MRRLVAAGSVAVALVAIAALSAQAAPSPDVTASQVAEAVCRHHPEDILCNTTTTTSTTLPPSSTTVTTTSTTTTVAPTTTTVPPTTTTVPPTTTLPSGAQFVEDFSDPAALTRFDSSVFHSGGDDGVWEGDHASLGGDACTGPDQTRTIQRGGTDSSDGPSGPYDPGWLYRCEPPVPGGEHLMTSLGPVGAAYSIGAFWPTQTFADVTEVRWDQNVSLFRVGDRQWTSVKIIPAGVFDRDRMPCINWAPCANAGDGVSTVTHDQLGSVAAEWGRFATIITPQNPAGFADGNTLGLWRSVDDPALWDITERRTHFFRDNGDGTLTYGNEQEDGSFYEHTIPGEFPTGPVRVVFADHNYSPVKGMDDFNIPESDRTFTWHWDNLQIIEG